MPSRQPGCTVAPVPRAGSTLCRRTPRSGGRRPSLVRRRTASGMTAAWLNAAGSNPSGPYSIEPRSRPGGSGLCSRPLLLGTIKIKNNKKTFPTPEAMDTGTARHPGFPPGWKRFWPAQGSVGKPAPWTSPRSSGLIVYHALEPIWVAEPERGEGGGPSRLRTVS